MNKKNIANFRSNFNFGFAKHIKPSQQSNFLLKSSEINQQVVTSFDNKANDNSKKTDFKNINQESSEIIDGSLYKFGFQPKQHSNLQNL